MLRKYVPLSWCCVPPIICLALSSNDLILLHIQVLSHQYFYDRHLYLNDDYPLNPINDNYLEKIQDRKSTRLNSSHVSISYAVFCLKKKNIATYFMHQ